MLYVTDAAASAISKKDVSIVGRTRCVVVPRPTADELTGDGKPRLDAAAAGPRGGPRAMQGTVSNAEEDSTADHSFAVACLPFRSEPSLRWVCPSVFLARSSHARRPSAPRPAAAARLVRLLGTAVSGAAVNRSVSQRLEREMFCSVDCAVPSGRHVSPAGRRLVQKPSRMSKRHDTLFPPRQAIRRSELHVLGCLKGADSKSRVRRGLCSQQSCPVASREPVPARGSTTPRLSSSAWRF